MPDRTGTTWLVDTLPCPECRNMTLIGYLLVDEEGKHMHTKYVCTFWPTGVRQNRPYVNTNPCGWSGWTVPGWDA